MTLRALWPVTQQFQAKNGSNLVGGKVYVYYQGRTALATTYHDEAGTVVNPNPVLLDNNGRATVFADTIYAYTIVVCDYYGKELFSQDITLHDAISTAEDVIVMGSNGSVKVDTTTLPNGVQYDLSVNTDIIATNESVNKVKTDLNNLTGTVNNHTTQIGQIQEDINGIESTVANKKDKQNELNFNGSATKTVKKITQNANGELNVEFEDISTGTYTAGDAIDLTNNTISVKYGKGLETTTDNKLQLKVGEGLTLDNDTLEVTFKDLESSITSFRTGDVIPVDGPSGTAKMSKDDLLREAAENAVESGVAGSKIVQDELVKASTEGVTDLATVVEEQRRFNASGMVYTNSTTKFVYSQVSKGDFVECHSSRIAGERMCLAFSSSAPVVGEKVDNVLYYNETEPTSDQFVYKFIAPSNGYIIANVSNAVASANVHFLSAVYCNKLNGIDAEIDEAVDKKVNPLFSDLQKTGQFTAADGYTNKTLFTGLNIKSGEKFTVRFSCDENSLTMLQLWVNNSYNQTLRNRDGQINADVVITASSDITSVGVLIPSDRVSATSNFTMSVVSGKVNGLYIKTDELQDEIDRITYSDQKTGQFTVADGYTNKTLFSNLKIKSGEKFVVRFSCDVDSLTMLQLWVNNSYNQTLRNRDGQINADVVITASSDITSVGVLIPSDRVSATSNFTMVLSYGSLASIASDVKSLDGKVSDCTNKIDNYGLPSYYTASWQETLIGKILAAMSCDNCFSMIFATDLHFNSNSGYSKNLMRMILDKTSVPIAVLGGDYVAAYGDSDDCDFASKKLLEFFAYVGKDKCFSVRGNHDFTIKTSKEMVTRDPNTGVTETKGYALNAITRPSCKYEPSIVSNEFYYYIDFPATKTRVMMINSCDGQVSDPTASWGVYIYLSPKQIKWIARTCLEKDGWNFVFAFHVPSDPALDSYASSQDEIQNIAKAINNNEVYTYDGETYDFSVTTSKVLFTISGHGHRDGSNVLSGVLNIETTSDAYYHDDVWTRTQGTTSEQAFDVFVVDFDARKLKAIRVGAGDDREWNI